MFKALVQQTVKLRQALPHALEHVVKRQQEAARLNNALVNFNPSVFPRVTGVQPGLE
jgi:hypothetical protein